MMRRTNVALVVAAILAACSFPCYGEEINCKEAFPAFLDITKSMDDINNLKELVYTVLYHSPGDKAIKTDLALEALVKAFVNIKIGNEIYLNRELVQANKQFLETLFKENADVKKQVVMAIQNTIPRAYEAWERCIALAKSATGPTLIYSTERTSMGSNSQIELKLQIKNQAPNYHYCASVKAQNATLINSSSISNSPCKGILMGSNLSNNTIRYIHKNIRQGIIFDIEIWENVDSQHWGNNSNLRQSLALPALEDHSSMQVSMPNVNKTLDFPVSNAGNQGNTEDWAELQPMTVAIKAHINNWYLAAKPEHKGIFPHGTSYGTNSYDLFEMVPVYVGPKHQKKEELVSFVLLAKNKHYIACSETGELTMSKYSTANFKPEELAATIPAPSIMQPLIFVAENADIGRKLIRIRPGANRGHVMRVMEPRKSKPDGIAETLGLREPPLYYPPVRCDGADSNDKSTTFEITRIDSATKKPKLALQGKPNRSG